MLNQSRLIVFLVSGNDKKEILRKIMTETEQENRLPAQWIHAQSSEPLWLISPESNPGGFSSIESSKSTDSK